MEHQQSVTRLSKNLANIIDRFAGLGEASRANSQGMFTMFIKTAEAAAAYADPCRYADPCSAEVCFKYQALPMLLVDAGFYVLGGGHFSIVLGHDDQPDTAFKISLKPEDSYVAYAMYCRQNPGPHLPKILCMIRAQEGQIIAIKRYSTFSEGVRYMPYEYAFPHASYSFMYYWREAETVRRDNADSISRNPIYTESYIQALLAIGEHFDGAATFDLHSDNLMFDPDTRTFIITDPVSFKKENSYVIERPWKNSDRTDHFTAA